MGLLLTAHLADKLLLGSDVEAAVQPPALQTDDRLVAATVLASLFIIFYLFMNWLMMLEMPSSSPAQPAQGRDC